MQTVAILGIGLMGSPIAKRLKQSDYQIIACNRTLEKLIPLSELGIQTTQNPKQAIEFANIIILMLTDFTAIHSVLFEDNTIEFTGRTIIQMATIAPWESIQLQEKLHSLNAHYLEAPVLGSIPEAQQGELIIMIGGENTLYVAAKPLLEILGKQLVYIGQVGQAAAVKLAMNQLIASLTAAFSLSLGLIKHYQVDTEIFMQIVRNSALYAKTFDKKLSKMLSHNYDNPNFPTQHLAKDIDLFLDVAKKVQLDTHIIMALQEILQKTLADGLVDKDYSAIYETLVLDKNE